MGARQVCGSPRALSLESLWLGQRHVDVLFPFTRQFSAMPWRIPAQPTSAILLFHTLPAAATSLTCRLRVSIESLLVVTTETWLERCLRSNHPSAHLRLSVHF